EDLLLEQRLAPSQDEIGAAVADEGLGVDGIRRRHQQCRHARRLRKRSAQAIQRARLPSTIGRSLEKPVIEAEREHVEKPERPDARDLTTDSTLPPLSRLANDERSDQRRKRAEPARQPLAIERRSIMADQQGAHGGLSCASAPGLPAQA